jgi:hypothetical protein
MSLETYHTALRFLELSMDRLKLDTLALIEPLHNLAPITPLSPPALLAENPLPTAVTEAQDEGPTPWDAEEAALVEPVDIDLLEEEDEDEQDEPFDVTLAQQLKRLLDREKKAKKPNPKRLIELTILSDYNNLQKSYINAMCKSPSVLASNRIAEAKFVPTVLKPVYQHKSWFARQLRVKAYHLVRFGSLPELNQGKGASHYSILCEEDVRRSILMYLRTLKPGSVSNINLCV